MPCCNVFKLWVKPRAEDCPEWKTAWFWANSEIVSGACQNAWVCATQAYAHHFFGNARFVVAEGSELRGTLDKLPLPHPYYQLVNGTFFEDPFTR